MASKGRGRYLERVAALRASFVKPQLPPIATEAEAPNPIKNEKGQSAVIKLKCPEVLKDRRGKSDITCVEFEDESEVVDPLDYLLPLAPGSTATVRKYHSDMKQMSEAISEGMEILCVTGAVCSPSELYLVLEKDWPKKVDKIAADVSKFYSHMLSMFTRYTWFPEQEDIKPDLLVAVYIRSDKEWFRGRILFRVDDNQANALFSVQLLDTGETHTIVESDIFYLDSYFMVEPQLAIKCRLQLDKKYEKYHTDEADWPDEIGGTVLKALFDKRFYAKFVRRVEQEGEMVWEVSIEGFDNESRNPKLIHKVISSVMENEKERKFNEAVYEREDPEFLNNYKWRF